MLSLNLTPKNKTLVLGTALWGWGINRHDAYELIERFIENGGSIIDAATNYPINKCSKDFGLATRWIMDWISVNGEGGLSLNVKIGAVDNMGSSDIDLESESIIRSANNLRDQFGDALSCISIHWDNRNDEENQLNSIEETVRTMAKLEETGLEIGMSGIKCPDLYLKTAPELCRKWIIQVKENISTRLARDEYQRFFPEARYLAYGINLGGLKIGPKKRNSSIALREINIPNPLVEKLSDFLVSNHGFNPRPTSFNELALAYSYVNPALSGIIIGPRDVEQLNNTIRYWEKLKQSTTGINDFELFNNLAE